MNSVDYKTDKGINLIFHSQTHVKKHLSVNTSLRYVHMLIHLVVISYTYVLYVPSAIGGISIEEEEEMHVRS